jgi:hypothetical protein
MSGSGAHAVSSPVLVGDERALAVSGLVLPRLAAFGPPLNLAMLDGGAYATVPAFTVARLAQMVTATFMGLVVLLGPMSVLMVATSHLAEMTSATQRQHVPGGVPVIAPGPTMLPPASSVTAP